MVNTSSAQAEEWRTSTASIWRGGWNRSRIGRRGIGEVFFSRT